MPGKYTIAIDGPAGAGKSTVARGAALALGYRYVDTGSMYRAVTLLALERNVDLNDHLALSELANNAKIDIIESDEKKITVLLNGRDVTEKIRDPLVTGNVSRVASVPGVRKVLAAAQSAMAAEGGVVMEGRDIGTAVIPDADFKFYIVASARERAARRARDLEKMGYPVDLEKLAEEIETRDCLDSSREVNPLRPAEDAEIIDCTGMTAQEVIDLIVKKVTEGRA
ncbi:MAG: (d)CMP kinase [Peptococcaceae bacterium]|nr:(d)CMP kinase [Peptococcaceae bacterium]